MMPASSGRRPHGGLLAPPSVERPREIRFIDLCAGLGGFHHATDIAHAGQSRAAGESQRPTFRCVLAAEIDDELRQLYVKNFGESLSRSYRQSFAPERVRRLLDSTHDDRVKHALDVYGPSGELTRVHGDIRALVSDTGDDLRRWPDGGEYLVPEHDLLCAGFPCQPFSKSGSQLGLDDTRGTVFHMIAMIIEKRRPARVLLENVGNFERHDKGNTWRRVRDILQALDYDVQATLHVGGAKGGHGLLSPHHLGLPHHRERFFMVAQDKKTLGSFEDRRYPFPLNHRQRGGDVKAALRALDERAKTALAVITKREHDVEDLSSAALAPDRVECVVHWNALLEKIADYERQRAADAPTFLPLPSFPIWGFELDPWNQYPADANPMSFDADELTRWHRRQVRTAIRDYGRASEFPPGDHREFLATEVLSDANRQRWIELWPAYARKRDKWPDWKQRFIVQSRNWGKALWTRLEQAWLRIWLDGLYEMTASHQKLEWNAQGEDLDLWKLILQFRPSGLRAKRLVHVPALVAMTTTQVPVIPARKGHAGARDKRARGRHLLPDEALLLQGFPATWHRPASRDNAFQALGNAVHAELVAEVIQCWIFAKDGPYDEHGTPLGADQTLGPSTAGARTRRRARSVSSDDRASLLPFAPATHDETAAPT